MSKEIKECMKEWSDLVNKETNNYDVWTETPIGNFKNLRFIQNENDEIGEIDITIRCDEWDKNQTDE
tara:strand:+ start:393 stop:593 length:201 start_codon:yes stop_codon:yes gene_type:complete